MSGQIRSATPAGADRIAVIYNQSAGKNTLGTVLRTGEYFREIVQSLDDWERLLVIEYGGEVAGYGILKKYS